MFAISRLSTEEIDTNAVRLIVAPSVYLPNEADRLERAMSPYVRGEAPMLGARLYGRVAAILGYMVEDGQIEIRHIATLPDYRGRNLGRQLVMYLRSSHSREEIVAVTDGDAVGFYRRCGFEVVEQEPVGSVVRYRCTLSGAPAAIRKATDPAADLRYEVLDETGLDRVAELWARLNTHHRSTTLGWSDHFARFTFGERIARLTAPGKQIRLDLATDRHSGTPVGYCISSLAGGHGELESIFVEPAYRHGSVGERLARAGIAWMDANGASDIEIVVAVGNEAALRFYERLGFSPRTYHLRRRPE